MHAGAQALVHLFPSSSCRYVRSDPKRLWHIITSNATIFLVVSG